MKVQNLTKTVLVALMIASPLASAESQYPAADFQPEIIKQDADLIAKHANASAASTSTSSSSNSSSSESKSTPVVSAPKQEESLNLTYILLGAAVAAGAFLLTRNKGATAAPDATGGFAPAPAPSNGTSGVQNYVNNLAGAPAQQQTGVQRYIGAMPATAPQAQTGVAKYLSSLPATEAKPAAAAAAPQAAKGATGVEKYVSALAGATPAAAAAETGVAKYLKGQGLAA